MEKMAKDKHPLFSLTNKCVIMAWNTFLPFFSVTFPGQDILTTSQKYDSVLRLPGSQKNSPIQEENKN